jgi:hypothetical protein
MICGGWIIGHMRPVPVRFGERFVRTNAQAISINRTGDKIVKSVLSCGDKWIVEIVTPLQVDQPGPISFPVYVARASCPWPKNTGKMPVLRQSPLPNLNN